MMIAEGKRERLKKVNVDKGLTTWITLVLKPFLREEKKMEWKTQKSQFS